MARDPYAMRNHRPAMTKLQASIWTGKITRALGAEVPCTIRAIEPGDALWNIGWDSGYYIETHNRKGERENLTTRFSAWSFIERHTN